MFYICSCPFEPNGSVGIWKCSDGSSFILRCDECEAAWREPAGLNAANAVKIAPPNYFLPGGMTPVYGGMAGWASRAEIDRLGWAEFVCGQSQALDEE